MRWDWDDARIFLAVAREGSTAAAARTLGLVQTTCARRIDSLEHSLGLKLFERGPAGFTLSGNGQRLLPLAEEMGRAAASIGSLAAQSARGRDAVVRLSIPDLLIEPVVHPALAKFRKSWPDVRVDLAVESRHADIHHGEADIAIRAGWPPDEPNLIVRRLAGNPMAAYCTQAYADRYGQPLNLLEFLDRPFGCVAGRMVDMIAQHVPEKRPSLVASGLKPLLDAVASGDLAALLPCPHADRIPDLIRCFPLEADTGAVWLIYHPALKDQRHGRDLVHSLTTAFQAWMKSVGA